MQLDLHETSHEQAERELTELIDDFIYTRNAETIKVVTGNSERMKEVVMGVIEEYGLAHIQLVETEIIIWVN